jgi:RNA polymerase sigma factor (sigma-70 family)
VTNHLLQTVLRRVSEASPDSATDAAWVRRFVESKDEFAFSALVYRHGPLVWAVCRQMLTNPTDADDAFQAVFLALIQSAERLLRVKSLGGWLHGVAVRVCLKARRSAVRRKRREKVSAKPESILAEPQWSDLHAAVHEEVERLPDALRTAFVLCELQGVRQPDAAAQLGWKLGTLSGRLTLARQLLMKKLTARGLTPAVVVGSVAIGGLATGGGVPSLLADHTLALFRNSAVGGSGISTTLLELARGATEGKMTKTKWTIGSLMLTTGLMVTVGTGWLPTADAQRPLRTPPDAEPGFGQGAGPTAKPAPRPLQDSTVVAGTDDGIAEEQPAKKPTTSMLGSTTVPATAQRFEHLLVQTPDTPQELVKLFQEKEKAGWEYVSTVAMANRTPHLVFKRPKGGSGYSTTFYPAAPAAASAPTANRSEGNTSAPTPPATAPASESRSSGGGRSRGGANPDTISAVDAPKSETDGATLPSGFEMVPLKNAKASEVAKVLRELYSFVPTSSFGPTRPGDVVDPFTVSADDRTNSVIFRPGRGASSKDVKAMIEKLDAASARYRDSR